MNGFYFFYTNKMDNINLSWKNLRPVTILSFLKGIKDKKKILSINLQGNFLSINGLHELFKYIGKEFINITSLNLSSTNLTMNTFYIISFLLKDLNYQLMDKIYQNH